ncbi:Signal peptidase I [Ralstonia solanacearum UW551]|uniref:Signal peptidase I n=1 Tax=Ralstonia solanacearum (strain UW551) TaxID=342110 RepID=A0AB33V9G3_RALSU|nr:signal peptidase I [Ralstonia solanacearum]EAP71485.1 Signal peptidase I [Ralstonia solanacearum UW551]
MKLVAKSLQAARDNKRFLVGMSLLFAFRACVADWAVVPSGSMNPTLIEGDYIIMNRLAYGVRVPATTVWLKRGDEPRRGDVVVFSSPEDGTKLVKRLIGLPGDVVEMRGEALYINHHRLAYTPLPDAAPGALPQATAAQPHDLWREALPGPPHPVMVLPEVAALRSFGPIVVPADHYLMLGEHRDNSRDSRYFGLVPRANLIARASHVAWSLDRNRCYLPRLGRLGKPSNERAKRKRKH